MVGTTMYTPKVAYRVLATDFEGETFTECWTIKLDDANRIANVLKTTHDTVQVDKIVRPPKR
jgi:hypothetical protein